MEGDIGDDSAIMQASNLAGKRWGYLVLGGGIVSWSLSSRWLQSDPVNNCETQYAIHSGTRYRADESQNAGSDFRLGKQGGEP